MGLHRYSTFHIQKSIFGPIRQLQRYLSVPWGGRPPAPYEFVSAHPWPNAFALEIFETRLPHDRERSALRMGNFELRTVHGLEPMATKSSVTNSANVVLKWMKREEDVLFITGLW